MTAYAFEGGVSRDARPNAIEITEQQYQDGIEGMLAGKLVTINGGFAVIDPPKPEPEPEPEPEPVDLAAYARDLSWRTRVDGTTINSVPVRLDDGSLALINGMVGLAERDAERTFNFDSAAGIVTLTAAQAITFGEAIGVWVQLTFDRRAAVLLAIEAGSLTTTAEIDAAFADVTAPWSAA
ncbi:DUF4376 domain-containing protein [Mycoplana dimorpha]|uniref:Uncharacterized protein DUF4376 n=1 Tax=Mycoplana dimorpha TaxID=28320 RepID=A0A2T5B1K2_MYCDI|nr:DUF4376 domain-containing protein [Mycoplana dimorpha]PTM92863.1 uncharacterized protein DUF4376 [Mycoplana dimorpha]